MLSYIMFNDCMHINPCLISYFTEFRRQVIRQLVTLNARSVEHSKYLDLLMVMVNDIKEKLDKVQEINPGNIDRQELENNVFSKLPVSNEETLSSLTEALALNSYFHDETVSYS